MTRKKRLTESEKKLIDQLRTKNYPYAFIAARLDLSLNTVKSYCRRHCINPRDIPRKTKAEKSSFRTCKYCGAPIENAWNRVEKQFCSSQCRTKYWNERKKDPKLSPAGRLYPAKIAQDGAGLPAPSEVTSDD